MLKVSKNNLKTYVVDALLVVGCIVIGLGFAKEIEQSGYILGIFLAIAVMASFFWLGGEKIDITHSLPYPVKKKIGYNLQENAPETLSTMKWVFKVMKLQLGFFILLLGLLFIFMPAVLLPAASVTESNIHFFVEFIRSEMMLIVLYPYALTAFFITLFGVVSRGRIPKMSTALEVMWGRKLDSLPAAVADFCVLTGFLIGLLAIASILAIFLGQLLGHYFGLDMHYIPSAVRTSAIGFALIYLPFTLPWKDLMANIAKATMFSFSTLLIFIGMGLAVYLVISTWVVDWLLGLLKLDPYKQIMILVQENPPPAQVLHLTLFILSFFAAPIVAIYTTLMSKGKRLSHTLMVLFILPCLFVSINLLLPNQSNLFFEKIFTTLFSSPFYELIAITISLALLIPWKNDSGLQEGLFLILPNEFNWKKTGRKRRRIRNFIKYGSCFTVYVMLAWLYMGMSGVQQFFMPFLTLSIGVVSVGLIGLFWFLLSKKITKIETSGEAKEHV